MSLILTQPQAEAVYSAMCALNSVGGSINASFESAAITVTGLRKGGFSVIRHRVPNGFPFSGSQQEDYADQSAFAAVYGLISAEAKAGDEQTCAMGAAFAWLPS
ncbi:MAG: hypothetical protein LBE61_09515 [Burkholderiaceae bacterium]|nr:hypothetical protein [Burkholderiaceae bacterium]